MNASHRETAVTHVTLLQPYAFATITTTTITKTRKRNVAWRNEGRRNEEPSRNHVEKRLGGRRFSRVSTTGRRRLRTLNFTAAFLPVAERDVTSLSFFFYHHQRIHTRTYIRPRDTHTHIRVTSFI